MANYFSGILIDSFLQRHPHNVFFLARRQLIRHRHRLFLARLSVCRNVHGYKAMYLAVHEARPFYGYHFLDLLGQVRQAFRPADGWQRVFCDRHRLIVLCTQCFAFTLLLLGVIAAAERLLLELDLFQVYKLFERATVVQCLGRVLCTVPQVRIVNCLF